MWRRIGKLDMMRRWNLQRYRKDGHAALGLEGQFEVGAERKNVDRNAHLKSLSSLYWLSLVYFGNALGQVGYWKEFTGFCLFVFFLCFRPGTFTVNLCCQVTRYCIIFVPAHAVLELLTCETLQQAALICSAKRICEISYCLLRQSPGWRYEFIWLDSVKILRFQLTIWHSNRDRACANISQDSFNLFWNCCHDVKRRRKVMERHTTEVPARITFLPSAKILLGSKHQTSPLVHISPRTHLPRAKPTNEV